MNCRRFYKVNKCIGNESNNKCTTENKCIKYKTSFLYSGSNNNMRAKNTRANIYLNNVNKFNKDKFNKNKSKCREIFSSLEQSIKSSKQKYMQNTGSQFSLLKKKYNLTRETKKNYYNNDEEKAKRGINKKFRKNKNSNYNKYGKPLPNPSLGSSSALSRAIHRRIAIKNDHLN